MKKLRPFLLILIGVIWCAVLADASTLDSTPLDSSPLDSSSLGTTPPDSPPPNASPLDSSAIRQSSAQKEERKLGQVLSGACGAIAGIVAKGVELPLDLLKVLSQTKKIHRSTYECVLDLLKREGVKGLYKGATPTVFGAAAETGLLFYFKDKIVDTIRHGTGDFGKNMTPMELCAISGAITGALVSIVLTPAEFFKCHMQVQPASTNSKQPRQGFTSLFRDVYRSSGGLRKMYTGHLLTLPREIIGTSAWFTAYEAWRQQERRRTGRSEISPAATIVGGSLAGMAYSGIPFPLDTVKTLKQTGSLGTREIVKDIYNTQGIRGFYRGLPVTMLRSIPSNATIFLVYEFLFKLLSDADVQTVTSPTRSEARPNTSN